MSEVLVATLVTVIMASTPLLLAAAGELVVERSGVLNLGVEGMMLAGAVTAFAATLATGEPMLGVLAGALGGTALAALFALLAVWLAANQVASGLALTIFGTGLTALIGQPLVGTSAPRLPPLLPEALAGLPVVGPLLFGHDPLVYLSWLAVPAISVFLFRTRAGTMLRACGENAEAAHALGHPVRRVRLLAVLFGGAMAGLGGAFLPLSYTPMWVEGMTAGRGWIALALVVFAAWRPWRVLLGAYLFGGVTVLQLHAQGLGLLPIPSQYLSMLPYLVTILALVVIHAGPWRRRLEAPACLGRPFVPPA